MIKLCALHCPDRPRSQPDKQQEPRIEIYESTFTHTGCMPNDMAESIVGIVIGSIGFLLTTRNLASRLLEDVHTVHRHADLLVQIAVRLRLSTHELEAWQDFWNLHDGCPLTLSRVYWGREDVEIQQVLGQIQNITKTVKDKLYKSYRSDLQVLSREPSIMRRIPDFDDTVQAGILDDHRQRLNGRHSLFSRTIAALFKTPFLEKEMQELEQLIELLQRSSKRFFISRHAKELKEQDEDWELKTNSLSFREHLIRFADDSCDTTSALYELLISTNEYAIELYLDHWIIQGKVRVLNDVLKI